MVTNEEWAEALESGNFDQGTGALYRNGQFCCLGVRCEIEGLKRAEGDENYDRFSFYDPDGYWFEGLGMTGETRDYSNGALPQEYEDKFGLNKIVRVPLLVRLRSATSGDWSHIGRSNRMSVVLMYMNDHGFSFKQIARFIRKNS